MDPMRSFSDLTLGQHHNEYIVVQTLHPLQPLAVSYRCTQLNRINVDILSAANTRICVALRPNSACPSMDALCGGKPCTYSIFDTPLNNDYKCCPVRSWAQPNPTK